MMKIILSIRLMPFGWNPVKYTVICCVDIAAWKISQWATFYRLLLASDRRSIKHADS